VILGGMLPPVEFDVREYHLQAPKEFYQMGRVAFLPHNVYANMPLGAEMLCLYAMMLTGNWYLGALVGKTVIAGMMPLTAAAVFVAGVRLHSLSAGVVAALCYVSIPWMIQVSNLGLVEGATALYWMLALYAAMLAYGAGQPAAVSKHAEPDGAAGRKATLGLVALSGYMAGAAAGCKYPALLFLVLPLLGWTVFVAAGGLRMVIKLLPNRDRIQGNQPIACHVSQSRGAPRRWLLPAVFLAACVAGGGLWYAKNWVTTGNPTYPLLYGVFGGRSWDPATDARWNRVHRPHDFSPHRLLQDTTRVLLTSPWISPLVVPLAALAIVLRAHRRLVTAVLLHVLWVLAAWWLLTHRIDRFWLPLLPELALLAGLGANWRQDKPWRCTLTVMLAMGLAWNLLVATSLGGGYNRYFVALKRLRTDPERLDPWHRYFNEHVSQGRVLLVGEAQVFDFEVPVLYNTCFDECIFEQLVKGRTARQVAAALAEQQVAYVFVHWGEIARYRSPGNYGFTEFVRPEVFQRLVARGVLEPLPPIQNHPGQAFRVVQRTARQEKSSDANPRP